ncbi:uncharacterized protein N0V89_005335 [Didymosphaeria variabile]|uniref:Uncharacterized protein n=1 Tax=Didymosphaeria variabile TaxID=1932322 RepID=A0A9W8XKL5_9PLEO|nr:uncharacterized protein N0V89_005335 [Didymosphaeria variabile]KAJ4353605.1 hypothetical protein N0V89_005335 [Didymosphaeria variabile]
MTSSSKSPYDKYIVWPLPDISRTTTNRLPQMASDNSFKRSNLFENVCSNATDDTDAHASKKQRITAAEPNWQEQLQSAAHGRLQKYQQIGVQDDSADERMGGDNDSVVDTALLPQEPATVEENRMRLPLRSTAASLSSDTYRMTHVANPAPNQFDRATTSARGQMAPPALPAPSQDASSTPTDRVILITPNVVKKPAVFNSYEHDFQALTQGYTDELNFTAVEIIVFLPWLFTNSSIARRFVNNGMDNKTHAEIIEHHRVHTLETTEIAKGYLDALRPANWQHMNRDRLRTLWNRKNQRTPDGWNATNIAMNGFVPDRIAKEGFHASAPASVPFRNLVQGVKKLPTGNDAADLTRAIEFANGDEAEKTFPGRDLLFPDDLIDIFKAIGHAVITEYHRDGKIVTRYRKLSRQKVNHEESATPGSKGKGRFGNDSSASGSRQKFNHFIPVEFSSPLPESSRQVSPQKPGITHSPWLSGHDTNASRDAAQLKPFVKPVSPMAPKPLPKPLPKPREPERPNTGGSLLRSVDMHSLSDVSSSIDMSHIVSAIEYARRPDQKDIAWHANPEHFARINRILEDELGSAMTPPDEQVAWEQHWEQVEGERQRTMDDAITALQQKYGTSPLQRASFTADDYEDLFGEPAPKEMMDLRKSNERVDDNPTTSSSMALESDRPDELL